MEITQLWSNSLLVSRRQKRNGKEELNMDKLVKKFLDYLGTERNLSAATIAAYSHDLAKFQEYLVKEHGKMSKSL